MLTKQGCHSSPCLCLCRLLLLLLLLVVMVVVRGGGRAGRKVGSLRSERHASKVGCTTGVLEKRLRGGGRREKVGCLGRGGSGRRKRVQGGDCTLLW